MKPCAVIDAVAYMLFIYFTKSLIDEVKSIHTRYSLYIASDTAALCV